MTRIDQFESVFKAADKVVFHPEALEIGSILVITDLDRAGANALEQTLRGFLAALGPAESLAWTTATDADFDGVDGVLDLVANATPDLVCTYRALQTKAWKRGHTLGHCLDVLTQSTDVPVLVVPHPERDEASMRKLQNTDRVMAMTDHLTGDHRLVNAALRFTQPGGRLVLANVEDSKAFERYIEAISKIPSIETDNARETILEQLLREPRDYIGSCTEACRTAGVDVDIAGAVTLGHHLSEYRRLVDENDVDLLVMHTKEDDQMAMHGLAYPLAVELRDVPLLML